MSALPAFYPVVDSVDALRRLLPVGVKLVQLRIKQRPDDELRLAVRAAVASCRMHDAQLVVNDHWRAALDAGADFIHLGQEDLHDADLAAIRRRGLRLGISTHDHAELERALALEPAYVALGPVYATASKAMACAPQGLARVRAWKRRLDRLPLVAIGGITLERAGEVLAAGADCVASIGDLARAPDPAARASAWLRATGAAP